MNERPCSSHEINVLFEHEIELKILKKTALFVRHLTESVAAQTDHYISVYVCENIAMTL